MSVDTATVKRIASLARIAITDAEAERLAPELGNILGWSEQLGEVDTAAVEPMTAVIPNHLRLRDDVITDGGVRDAVLAHRPEERRVGKECVSTCRSRVSRCRKNKKINQCSASATYL